MNMYTEEMCNYFRVENGYNLAHRSKTNALEVIAFDKDLVYNLMKIKEALEKKHWDDLFIYYRFMIHLPKDRIVDALTFKGRIVQHVLCDNILKPYFEPRLIKENCACREGKGTLYASKLCKQNLVSYLKHNNDGYCLKLDVKSYFPSINRQILKSLLKNFPDQSIKEILFWIIDHCPEKDGLPIGNQTSQWMALWYLNKIDRIIKEKYRIKYYVRYMDDLIIIHKDKIYLEKLLAELTRVAKDELNLAFNQKTQIFPLHKGISFLGWKYYYTKDTHKIITKVDSKKKQFRSNKIKEAKYQLKHGLITKKEYDNKIRSLKEYLSYGNTYKYTKSLNI